MIFKYLLVVYSTQYDDYARSHFVVGKKEQSAILKGKFREID